MRYGPYWKSRNVGERTSRYNVPVSRLRRLFLAEKMFFITCCLARVRTPLTIADFEALAGAIARVRKRRAFKLAGYVFMPDHWHALVIPRDQDELPRIMDALKVASARSINFRRRAKGALWQSRYYDRAVRTVKEYHDALRYMHLNPVEKGLVEKLEDWPWSSVHAFGGAKVSPLPIDRPELPAEETTPL